MSADSGIWPSPSSDMYRANCDHSVQRLGGIYCLSVVGWLFTIVFTYLGFACMIVGEPFFPVRAYLKAPLPMWSSHICCTDTPPPPSSLKLITGLLEFHYPSFYNSSIIACLSNGHYCSG